MAKYNTYPHKNAPESGDTILIYDTTNDANKQIYFTVFWNWLLNLIRTTTLSNFATTSKTIEGAVNEVKQTADTTASYANLTQAQVESLIALLN